MANRPPASSTMYMKILVVGIEFGGLPQVFLAHSVLPGGMMDHSGFIKQLCVGRAGREGFLDGIESFRKLTSAI